MSPVIVISRILAMLSLVQFLPVQIYAAETTITSTTTITNTKTKYDLTSTVTSTAPIVIDTAIVFTTITITGSPPKAAQTSSPPSRVLSEPPVHSEPPVQPQQPGKPDTMPYDPAHLEAAVINSTNYYRSQHLAVPVTWNATLAAFAKKYSEGCSWKHSGGPYGENLAEGYPSPTIGIDGWGDEEVHYNYRNPGFGETTGHFTQLVWKNTTSVGCAATKCSNSAPDGANGWFLVCEYFPRGNIIGSFDTMVQKPGMSLDGQLGFGKGARTEPGKLGKTVGAVIAGYLLMAIIV